MISRRGILGAIAGLLAAPVARLGWKARSIRTVDVPLEPVAINEHGVLADIDDMHYRVTGINPAEMVRYSTTSHGDEEERYKPRRVKLLGHPVVIPYGYQVLVAEMADGSYRQAWCRLNIRLAWSTRGLAFRPENSIDFLTGRWHYHRCMRESRGQA